ncbi:hypothetical protein QSI_3036 [Clostridioides difficile P28]|nr:hypothetical protein QSI_3036 [Clostridioides difficile P28]
MVIARVSCTMGYILQDIQLCNHRNRDLFLIFYEVSHPETGT